MKSTVNFYSAGLQALLAEGIMDVTHTEGLNKTIPHNLILRLMHALYSRVPPCGHSSYVDTRP